MEKIAGCFLCVHERRSNQLTLEYVNRNNEVSWVTLHCNNPEAEANLAKESLQKALDGLAGIQGDGLVRLQAKIDAMKIAALTPEISIAYRGGKNLDSFFERPLPTREEILAVAKASKQTRDKHQLIELRIRRVTGETHQTGPSTTWLHEERDTFVLTVFLLPESVRESIGAMAGKFAEVLGELYYSLLKDVEPLFSLDTLIECLENQDKFNDMFVTKVSLQRVQAFADGRLKHLMWDWRRRLSASTKHVLQARLEGEYGKTFALEDDEFIRAGRLSVDDFRKAEHDEWLPKMRQMLETCEAEKLLRLDKKAANDDGVPIQGETESLRIVDENIFRKHEITFEIRFQGGETSHVRRRVGLSHIRALLQTPREDIPSFAFSDQPDERMEGWQAEQQGLTIVSKEDASTGLDRRATEELEAELKRLGEVDIPTLRENMEDFQTQGRDTEADECKEEIEAKQQRMEQIAKRLKRDEYPEQERNAKKAQNRVRNAIEDALTELERNKGTKEFALHFRESYSGGVSFCYKPKKDIKWVTV
jgi:hypothetical protein